ncbi:MAG: hypothetical protein ACO1TE_29545 [Prosthecobacter sp.]
MDFRSLGLPRFAPVVVFLITAGCSLAVDVVAPLVDSLSADPAAWKSAPLSADWKDLGAAPGTTRKELASPETVLGVPVQRSIATTSGGVLSRLDVLFVERAAGSAPADAAWQQTLRQTASQVSATLQTKLGKPGTLVKPGVGAANGTVIQEWTTPASQVRLTLEPNRVWVSLTPASAPALPDTATAATSVPMTKDDRKARVQHRENGDVIITALPTVPDTDEASNLMLRMIEQLNLYYSWKVDCLAIAKSIGWTPDSTIFDEAKLFAAVGKEAKVRFKMVEGFDLLEIQHWIDRGQPVLFVRVWTELRHLYHVEFAPKLATDPAAELPPAKDAAEKAKWPSDKDPDFYACEATIVGYNKKRGELIFSHPGWGKEDENMRMREEEAATSTLALYYLPPD